ncbi:unnamed protein product, partial [Effrenium voratum]
SLLGPSFAPFFRRAVLHGQPGAADASWMIGFCCGSRWSAKSQETSFDRLLLDGFARVAGAGLLRSQPSNISRRRLDGNLGVCIQFSSTHFAKKRKANDQQSVVMPADPQAFNFTKIKEEEVVGVVEASGMQVVCMVCASPLSVGHMLLVPQRDKVYPQVLTEEFLMCGLRLLALSGRLDIRVLFNSLLGHASVNHFHLHAIYLELCGFGNGFANGIGAARFPVEKAERSKLGGGRGVGQVCAEILVEGRWYCRGLVLSAGAPRGSETDGGEADLEALGLLAWRVVQLLQEKNVPHNVMLVPYQGERKKPPEPEFSGLVEEPPPPAASPEIYIFPRQAASACREDPGFNAAIMEISGLLVAQSEQHFREMDQATAEDIFTKDVSLPVPEFEDLICKVTWMLSES